VGRKAKIEKRVVPVEATVRDAIRTLATTLSKDVKIIENYESVSDKDVTISGDETQLQQIVINLCSNAADSLRETGGTIHIRLHCPNEASVVIAISDTGPGIPDDIKQKIFEPFFTTKSFGAGLGMGLAVVHGIVHAYGGDIVCKDLLPHGTEFQVTLPQCERPKFEEMTLVEIESVGGTENILLVDDEIEIVSLLKDTLAAFGYNVFATHDTTEAQRLFRTYPIDLVLTDLTMPGMTGIALAQVLKAIRPKVPIVLCTGFSDTKLKASESALFAGFTTKPLDGFAINESIRAALTT
jgi:two-component system, cell cycle sensor histidine kinase and response regulator CckA